MTGSADDAGHLDHMLQMEIMPAMTPWVLLMMAVAVAMRVRMGMDTEE